MKSGDRNPQRTSGATGRPNALPSDSMASALWQSAQEVVRVLNGQSLSASPGANGLSDEVKEIVFGVLRRYGEGDALLALLLRAPPYPEIRALLLCALYRLATRTDGHTVVNQAVEAAGQWADGHYKGLVNGVLRNFLRQRETLEAELPKGTSATLWHPDWWLDRLRAAHPDHWETIVSAGNRIPPFGLRVNARRSAAKDYLARLRAVGLEGVPRGEAGIVLEKPVPVALLPGFSEGLVSVQDYGAQRAAELLNPPEGSEVLDACAAPGGKSAHLLERGTVNLTALDIDPHRCRRIEENLKRLGLRARVRCGDASRPHGWGRTPTAFDAILADVPCSASGVARRNPDIKWLRQPRDLLGFSRTQRRILECLWPALTPGGKLLYATCSVFPEENEALVAKFMKRAPDASLETEEHWLPGDEHDGFYYALLRKQT